MHLAPRRNLTVEILQLTDGVKNNAVGIIWRLPLRYQLVHHFLIATFSRDTQRQVVIDLFGLHKIDHLPTADKSSVILRISLCHHYAQRTPPRFPNEVDFLFRKGLAQILRDRMGVSNVAFQCDFAAWNRPP